VRFITKKRVAAAVAAVAIAGGGMAAYAYFTTTGAGTGSGTTGSSTPVVLHGTAATTLYPGTSSSVSFTVDNPSPGHQYVNTISLASVSVDAGHSTCVVADYTMPDVVAHQDIAGNATGAAVTATGTLSMANTAVSQDACQGATLTLHLTSN
jgi:hypothetical protein